MKKKIILSASLFFCLNSFATADDGVFNQTNFKKNWRGLFLKCKNLFGINNFIETGTYMGATTAIAAQVFSNVHSIELSENLYNRAVEMFKNNKNVTLHLGDSAQVLPVISPKLKEKSLYWLDGHFSGGITALGNQTCPALIEIEAVKGVKDAIILIDDVRLFGTKYQNKTFYGDRSYPLLETAVRQLIGYEFQIKIVGDILVAFKKEYINLTFSPLIDACTKSRLYDGYNFNTEEILLAEKNISEANELEKSELIELNKFYCIAWKNAPHYHLWYALVLSNDNKHSEAIKELNECIKMGFTDWRIYWYLSKNYAKIGQDNVAIEHFNKATALNPDLK